MDKLKGVSIIIVARSASSKVLVQDWNAMEEAADSDDFGDYGEAPMIESDRFYEQRLSFSVNLDGPLEEFDFSETLKKSLRHIDEQRQMVSDEV